MEGARLPKWKVFCKVLEGSKMEGSKMKGSKMEVMATG